LAVAAAVVEVPSVVAAVAEAAVAAEVVLEAADAGNKLRIKNL
jgi:hypothetical protein